MEQSGFVSASDVTDVMTSEEHVDQEVKAFKGEILYKEDGSVIVFQNLRYNNDVTLKCVEANCNANNNNCFLNKQSCVLVNSNKVTIPELFTFCDNFTEFCENSGGDKDEHGEDERRQQNKAEFLLPNVCTFRVKLFQRLDDVTIEATNDDVRNHTEEVIKHTKHDVINSESDRKNPILLCFLCRLQFISSRSFVDHVISAHDVCLNKLEIKSLKTPHLCAFLQKAEETGSALCILDPISSIATPEESILQTPSSQLLPSLQLTESEENSSINNENCENLENSLDEKSSLSIAISNPAQSNKKDEEVVRESSVDEVAGLKLGKIEELQNLGKLPVSVVINSSDHRNNSTKSTFVTSKIVSRREPNEQEEVLDLSSSSIKSTCSSLSSAGCQGMSSTVASPLTSCTSSMTSQKYPASKLLVNDVVDAGGKSRIMKSSDSLDFSKQASRNNMSQMKETLMKSLQAIMTSQAESAAHQTSTSRTSSVNVPDMRKFDTFRSNLMNTNQQDMETAVISSSSKNEQMFPMSLFQSRNSCKTLKCPKCNWHYKYRQTLEAHMKEKHLDEVSDCEYCNAGHPHPRLSRGENYSCGYKPFKCNICNYSTTTKGNLSIHMQSDKHLYNARAIHQKQDRAEQEDSSTSINIARHDVITSEAVRSSALKRRQSPNYDETIRDTKTFNSSRHVRTAVANGAVTSDAFPPSLKSDLKIQARRDAGSGGKWRCEVCRYETDISRNFHIHKTSEKHAQNVAFRERETGSQHKTNEGDQRGGNSYKDIESLQQNVLFGANPQAFLDYYATPLKSNSAGYSDAILKSFPTSGDDENVRKIKAQFLQHQLFLAQQQQLFFAQHYQQLMVAAASSLQKRFASQSIDNDVNKGEFPSVCSDGRISQVAKGDVKSCHVFSCEVCGMYGADDINKLEFHMEKSRHSDLINNLMSNEWTRVNTDGHQCRLCGYSTPLKTNFSLHCKTDKHISKLHIMLHVKEGGAATEWMIPHVISGNMTQNITCNLCHSTKYDINKMKQHCLTDQHQRALSFCQHLHAVIKSRFADHDVKAADLRLKCRVCTDFSTKHVIGMMTHMSSNEHQVGLQNHKNPQITTLEDLVLIKSEEQTKKKDSPQKIKNSQSINMMKQEKQTDINKNRVCEFCNYVTDDGDKMRHHLMTQHGKSSQCPLCQDEFQGPMELQAHLVNAHELQIPALGKISQRISTTNQKSSQKSSDANTVDISNESENQDDVNSKSMPCDAGVNMDADVTPKDESDAALDVDVERKQADVASSDVEISFHPLEEEQIQTMQNSIDKTLLQNQLNTKVLKTESIVDNTGKSPNIKSVESDQETPRDKSQGKSLTPTPPESLKLETTDGEVRSASTLFPSVTDAGDMSGNNIPPQLNLPTREMKTKRIRMRSYPLDGGSRSRAHCHLLSNYGLEQAMQYIENRSSENRERAKSFILGKRKLNLDGDLTLENNEANKENHNGSDSASSDQCLDEDSSLTCRRCGKKFTSLLVLKAHEEEAHDLCVPAQHIQKLATTYSDKMQEQFQETNNSLHYPDATHANEERLEKNLKPFVKLNSKNFHLSNASQTANRVTDSISLQQQAILNALLTSTGSKQQSLPDQQTENVNPAMYLGDPLTANLMSQMGIYASMFQAQAAGITPYQMLANAAVMQQLQQLALQGNSMLRSLEDKTPDKTSEILKASHLLNGSATAFNIKSGSSSPLPRLPKQDDGNSLLKHTLQTQMMQKNTSINTEMPAKRPRTRITDEQLKVLRANFDINNSPSEEQIDEMASRTLLPSKVIKHWFRNTLFKERQRSKDSPYNFNIPPTTSLEDAYTSTKHDIQEASPGKEEIIDISQRNIEEEEMSSVVATIAATSESETNEIHASTNEKISNDVITDPENMKSVKKPTSSSDDVHQSLFANALSLVPNILSGGKLPAEDKPIEDRKRSISPDFHPRNKISQPKLPAALINSVMDWQALTQYERNSNNDFLFYNASPSLSETGVASHSQSGSSSRRTPRTRFTDFQLQVLQEFFDHNAYPKDEDLDQLSRILKLSTRVIVVWFQNARQKARKSYDQQHAPNIGITSSSFTASFGKETEAKSESVRQISPSGVEDLAKKALHEIYKALSERPELQAFSESRSSKIKSLNDVSPDRLIPKAPTLSLKTNDQQKSIGAALTCHICDQTFATSELWQRHQQCHLTASMVGQYSNSYMQRLMGNPRKAGTNDKSAVNRTIYGSKGELQPHMQKDGEVEASSFQNRRVASNEKSVSNIISSQLTNLHATLSTKVKMNTSPTMTYAPTSPRSSATQKESANAKRPFPEDKDGIGMQKDPKRLRTTISPDQLEYLYQQYLVDSSPSRKLIEQISEVVGLKKRVVQVWFQNTRARQRKGQFRSSVSKGGVALMNKYKRCYFCSMLLKNTHELDFHIQAEHSTDANQLQIESPPSKKCKYEDMQISASDCSFTGDCKPHLSPDLDDDIKYKLVVGAAKDSEIDQIKMNIVSTSDEQRDFQPSSVSSRRIIKGGSPQDFSKDGVLFPCKINQKDSQNQLAALLSFPCEKTSSEKDSLYDDDEPSGLFIDESNSPEADLRSNSDQETSNAIPGLLIEEFPTLPKERSAPLSKVAGLNFPELSTSRLNLSPRQPTSPFSAHLVASEQMPSSSKRYRTHMNNAQVRALKDCFEHCRMPTLAECENLGNALKLQKRVVQVWFQNARAKERKRKVNKMTEDIDEEIKVKNECGLCCINFTSQDDARKHIFSSIHIYRLMEPLSCQARIDAGRSVHLGDASSSFNDLKHQILPDQTGFVPSPSSTDVSCKSNDASESSLNHQHPGGDLSSEEIQLVKFRSSSAESDGKETQSTLSSEEEQSSVQEPFVRHPYHTPSNQEKDADDQRERSTQSMMQHPLQKSLYKMMQRAQASSTGSQ